MSTILRGQNNDFIEKDCILNFRGKQFEADGAYLFKRKDNGLREGILYHYPVYSGENNRFVDHFLGIWNGSVKVHAVVMNQWRSNFGDERTHFFFRWTDGKKFWGINAGDNDIVRVKEYKNQ